MIVKTAFALLALAVPALCYEPVTCTTKNETQNIVVEIASPDSFCTMLTGYGVSPVAPNEGCASSYCTNDLVANVGGKPNATAFAPGFILSKNYAVNNTVPGHSYVQITGCINSSVWAMNPTDDGGQMDSHGWPYNCKGYNKFVSLMEPTTNTYCIRCCEAADNSDCDTSHSTKGCWNLIPGLYQMPDGSACAPPAGAPNSTVPTTTASGMPTASTGAASGKPTNGGPSPNGANGGTTTSSPQNGGASRPTGTSSHLTSNHIVGAIFALALAVAAF